MRISATYRYMIENTTAPAQSPTHHTHKSDHALPPSTTAGPIARDGFKHPPPIHLLKGNEMEIVKLKKVQN